MSTPKIQKSPLDKARAHEFQDWERVTPIFKATRSIGNPTYVYFVGEEEAGALKIGLAKDPIKRLRGLQTGNPRRLAIEDVLVGNRETEALFHEMWEEFAIYSVNSKHESVVGAAPGTEWFRPEIRERLMPIVADAAAAQADYFVDTDPENYFLTDLEQIVREAHIDADHVVQGIDRVHLLGSLTGYAVSRTSRI